MTDAPRQRRNRAPVPTRAGYARLRHPFIPQGAFSDDEIEAMHDTALRVLENLGIRIFLRTGKFSNRVQHYSWPARAART